MTDEPFGRQALPVTVTINGHEIDVDYWMRHLKRSAQSNGDLVQQAARHIFKIYPRANNE